MEVTGWEAHMNLRGEKSSSGAVGRGIPRTVRVHKVRFMQVTVSDIMHSQMKY